MAQRRRGVLLFACRLHVLRLSPLPAFTHTLTSLRPLSFPSSTSLLVSALQAWPLLRAANPHFRPSLFIFLAASYYPSPRSLFVCFQSPSDCLRRTSNDHDPFPRANSELRVTPRIPGLLSLDVHRVASNHEEQGACCKKTELYIYSDTNLQRTLGCPLLRIGEVQFTV